MTETVSRNWELLVTVFSSPVSKFYILISRLVENSVLSLA